MFQEILMTTREGRSGTPHEAEVLRRARHLRDAMIQRAQERGHTPADVARTMDMSVGHWYRVKKQPERLRNLTLKRLQAVAAYVGWPLSRVMVAVGWLDSRELDEVIPPERTVQDALSRLQRGAVSNGLVTPVAKAAPDHQALIARLFLLAEGAAAANARS